MGDFMFYCILTIVVLIILLGLFIYTKITYLKEENDNLKVALDKIKVLLDKKKELLLKLVKILKYDNTILDNDNQDVFLLDTQLFDLRWDLNKLLEESKNKKIPNIIKDLDLLEEELLGLKDFYNSHAKDYNFMYDKKVLCCFYKLFKLERKELFSVKKLDKYEILKED